VTLTFDLLIPKSEAPNFVPKHINAVNLVKISQAAESYQKRADNVERDEVWIGDYRATVSL